MPEMDVPYTTITEFLPVDTGIGLPMKYIIDQKIPVINGRIKFYIKDFNCIFDVRVLQHQSDGTYYAKDLKKPNNEHLEILNAWVPMENRAKVMAITDIYFMIRDLHKKKGDFTMIKQSGIAGRISELTNLRVLSHNGNLYTLDFEYATKIIDEEKF